METLLDEQGVGVEAAKLRRAYPIDVPDEDDVARNPDRAEARFARVVGGRAIDGVALYRDARASAPALPVKLTTAPNDVSAAETAVLAALDDLIAYVERVYEAIGDEDAPAWRAERLEYDLDVHARDASAGVATFDAEPSSDGSFDWYAFDLLSRRAAGQAMARLVSSRRHFRSCPRTFASAACRTSAGGISNRALRTSARSSRKSAISPVCS